MQALADSNYLFHDIFVGWPGSVHDARVFSNSQLYALGYSGRLFPPEMKEDILGKKIHPVILAVPAYPMSNWLVKSQPENVNSPINSCYKHFGNYEIKELYLPLRLSFGGFTETHTHCFKWLGLLHFCFHGTIWRGTCDVLRSLPFRNTIISVWDNITFFLRIQFWAIFWGFCS